MEHTLLTYRNLEELRKIQEEREVFPFGFEQTKDMLNFCADICIDISALVYFLLTNKNNILPVSVQEDKHTHCSLDHLHNNRQFYLFKIGSSVLITKLPLLIALLHIFQKALEHDGYLARGYLRSCH